jgi:hypothetical protein
MQASARKKVKEAEDTACVNPTVGQEKIAAYIIGDLTEEEHREFVTHVGDCKYCLEQIVLWRTAEVLAEAEDQAVQAVHTA